MDLFLRRWHWRLAVWVALALLLIALVYTVAMVVLSLIGSGAV